jgi:putative spermidine/putrescine transport system permease protein
VDQAVAAPGPLADPGALGPAAAGSGPAAKLTVLTVLRWLRRVIGIVPFGVYVTLGLLLPMVAVAVGAFRNSATGGFTLSNIHAATHGVYLHGFAQSIELTVIASVLPGIFGLLIAYAIFTAKRGNVLRQVTITASGVFANFGGVPLAFLFIASLGSSGLITTGSPT